MSSRRQWMILTVILTILGYGLLSAGEKPTAPQDASDRQADRDAIRATVKSFVEAFEKGDSSKAATFLTEGAELVPDDAPPIRGRKALQDAITASFTKSPGHKIALEQAALRFTSSVTATEDGVMKTTIRAQAPISQRYSLQFVKEDGKWNISSIREWAQESDALRDLDWLIGSWQAKSKDAEMQTTYEWIGHKAFIRGNITMRQKDRTVSAMQIIGLDPTSGELHIWIFESDGGFAQGHCTRDGDTWAFETRGVLADGGALGAKNLLHRVNNDTITWQPVNLRFGNDLVSDLPPIKVTRVKASR
ncbi:MAG: SgcJ/EcaC family oxidoreductase [Gemmatales bacterium]